MINSACWIVSKPLGVELSALGVRTAWATHQNGFDTRLLFVEEGVLCLAGAPGYHATMLRDFLDADGEVYCVREHLAARGVDEAALPEGAMVIPAAEVAAVCEDCETVCYF